MLPVGGVVVIEDDLWGRRVRGAEGDEEHVWVDPVRHRRVGITEVDDVDHELTELCQLLRCIHRPGGKNRLEKLIRLADPLLADWLVGIVGNREWIIEVDLLVAVCQGGRGNGPGPDRVGHSRKVGIGWDNSPAKRAPGVEGILGNVRGRHVKVGEARIGVLSESAVVGERAGGGGWRGRGVVVGPGEVVHLPAIECEEPSPALSVQSIGEADRCQAGQAAGERGAIDVLQAVEPLQVGVTKRRIELGVGLVQVHLVGLVETVGVDAGIHMVVVCRQCGRCGRRWWGRGSRDGQVERHATHALGREYRRRRRAG